MLVDAMGRVRFASEGGLRLFGPNTRVGHAFADLLTEADRPAVRAYLASFANPSSGSGRYFGPVAIESLGRRRVIDLTGRILDEPPGFKGIVLTIRDVTAYADREAELSRRAFTDLLTGLANRETLKMQIAAAASPSALGSVLFLDLDGFKTINDHFGHRLGDELLVATAHRLTQSAPAGATVGRIGGDEFVILLPSTSPSAAETVARQMLEALAEPFRIGTRKVRVSASVGVSALAAGTVDEVLRQADQAMYEAKHRGRATVVRFGPSTQLWTLRRRELAQRISELEAEVGRLHSEARTDVGTGLPNLRKLLEDLQTLQHDATQYGRQFAVLFIDLDYFGALNKHLGDEHGDLTLRRVADALSAACRPGDTMYRKGGEELVGLLPDTSLDAAIAVAERLRTAIEHAGIPHGGHPDTPIVTASIGVAAGEPHHPDAHQVLISAGHEMLHAKENGRNRVSAGPGN
jgi:diguanylate cyclase (GGDEF)-like protein